MRRLLTFLSLSVPLATFSAAAIQAQTPQTRRAEVAPAEITLSNNFDQWAREIIEEWKIPGMAVGAIKDGEVVLLKGYGYRNLEDQEPVTPQTLMAIGSNSKSFTVVLMGQLVDEGKLDWDKPVRHYLPDFRLWDDYATRKMRVKDLVTHVSGLPRHDVLWYGRSSSRPEIYERLRYLEPSTSLRGRYQYNNLMFLTAGYLAEQITGRSWDDLIRERIFRPLGMNRSSSSANDMPGSGDFSYPYNLRDGELTRIPIRNIDNAGPAGSINSSVEEMLHYIEMHINKGEQNGRRILSKENEEMMQRAQSVQGARDRYTELGPQTYGLATRVSSYRGRKWVQHGGGIDGFISQMAWLPNDGIGVMVLTNMSGSANPVPTMVVRRVFDDLLGEEPIDWNARMRKEVEEGRARTDSTRKAAEAERVAGTSPSHALGDYAGTYEHPGYGTLDVSVQGSELSMQFDRFPVPLKHFHYDVFEMDNDRVMVPMLSGRVQFLMNIKGQIDRVAIPLERSVSPIVFKRKEM